VTENEWSYSSAPPCAFVACRGTALPSLTLADSDSKTFAAKHKEFCVLVHKTQVPLVLRCSELSCVVTDAICVYTNNVGEEVGLYRTALILEKFNLLNSRIKSHLPVLLGTHHILHVSRIRVKRRLKILLACAAVKKKLIARATRRPEFLQPFHRTCVSHFDLPRSLAGEK